MDDQSAAAGKMQNACLYLKAGANTDSEKNEFKDR